MAEGDKDMQLPSREDVYPIEHGTSIMFMSLVHGVQHTIQSIANHFDEINEVKSKPRRFAKPWPAIVDQRSRDQAKLTSAPDVGPLAFKWAASYQSAWRKMPSP